MNASTRCYAVRRLNPFAGVVQIVETDLGRAVSTDAINWEVQLLGLRPAGWGSLNRDRVRRQHFRYAFWSAEDGLTCFPVPPQLDRHKLGEAATQLLEVLRRQRPPFPLEDRYERWLLDAGSGEPFALLASVTRRDLIPPRGSAEWRASAPGQAVAAYGQLPALVAALVGRRAGRPARGLWFERRADGSGIGLDPANTSHPAAELPASQFPELPLSEIWPRPEDAALVADYLRWLAPLLLVLPISLAARERLEAAAEVQPQLVERLHALYPALADAQRITRIRVQARISRASGAAA